MGHVVNMPVRLPQAEMFEHEDMARLYAVWRNAAQTGALPKLRDFAPRLLGRWMAWSGIVEAQGEPHPAHDIDVPMRWRLAGSALCRLAGYELTRRAVLEDWQRFERATLRRLLQQALFQHEAFLARLQLQGVETADGRLELLVLPLHDVARGQDVVLMVFRPHFPADMVVPSRLAAARLLSLRPLESGRNMQLRQQLQGEGPAAMAKVLPLFADHQAHA